MLICGAVVIINYLYLILFGLGMVVNSAKQIEMPIWAAFGISALLVLVSSYAAVELSRAYSNQETEDARRFIEEIEAI